MTTQDSEPIRQQPEEEQQQQQQGKHFPATHYNAAHSSGPLSFFNTTTHYHSLPLPAAKPSSSATALGEERSQPKNDGEKKNERMYHVWRSRDNRKGRHAAVVVVGESHGDDGKQRRRPTNSVKEVMRGVGKMFVRWPVWDVSWEVAFIFTVGSVIWCLNGCFAWLPLVAPSTEFEGETDVAAGWLAFAGATVFMWGSVLLMLEAVNENRSDCFGWAVEEALENHGMMSLLHNHETCRHHHAGRKSWLKGGTLVEPAPGDNKEKKNGEVEPQPGRKWSWWPTLYELRTHYINEIGFLAALSQFIGATIFWMAGFTSIPPIYETLSTPVMNGTFWLPQVVGGTGFIVSSFLIMLETQKKWYLPAPKMLGWHIGLWNFIGAIGFTLCGALGFGAESSEAVEYASTLCTFIGSWAFLIGSLIQWYESLNKYPLSVEKNLSWVSLDEES
ncbi:hypothetical protein QBC44DRAFT_370876 [Cladorrhinum sp. PSN332]|nr:hypothetical protein QBC44DRAFT_370876 [Cladorrhinum sp. PSN332]